MKYTPEEVAKLLADRPQQQHYIEAMIWKCIAEATPASTGAEPVPCACGDFYPPDSFGAGFIAARGECPNCVAGNPPAQDEAVRRDAERYRYLRDRSGDHGLFAVSIDYWSDEYLGQAACDVLGGAYLDQEIDAASDAAIAQRGEVV